MKPQKRRLAAALFAIVLAVAAVGRARILASFKPDPIRQPDPALATIDELYVALAYTEPNTDGLLWKDLRRQIEQNLTRAGIKMYSGDLRTWPVPSAPVLLLDVDLLKLDDARTYVFRIQLSLSRPVYLTKDGPQLSRADVWKKGSVLKLVGVREMPAAVTAAALEELDTFILAHRAANPPDLPAGRTPLPATIEQETSEPETTATRAAGQYVASKNSEVFHLPSCRSVKRISAENIVAYKTRQEALAAGKRPCKWCKP